MTDKDKKMREAFVEDVGSYLASNPDLLDDWVEHPPNSRPALIFRIILMVSDFIGLAERR